MQRIYSSYLSSALETHFTAVVFHTKCKLVGRTNMHIRSIIKQGNMDDHQGEMGLRT